MFPITVQGCDLCGSSHGTHECVLLEPSKMIVDRIVPSLAHLTLPTQLCSVGSGKEDGVVALGLLSCGTQFGPFRAPRTEQLSQVPCLPFKVFDTGENKTGLFLDTHNENLCNWMCLVRPAESYGRSNLMAFQVKEEVFFRVHKDIDIGEELLVAYSPHYARKMELSSIVHHSGEKENSEISIAPPEKSAGDKLCLSEQKFKFRPILIHCEPDWGKPVADTRRCSQRKRERPAKLSDYRTMFPNNTDSYVQMTTSTNASPTKAIWTCSKCSLSFRDESTFNHHCQEHLISPKSSSVNQNKDIPKVGPGLTPEVPQEKQKDTVTLKPVIIHENSVLNKFCTKPCAVRISRLREDLSEISKSISNNETTKFESARAGSSKAPKVSSQSNFPEESNQKKVIIIKSLNDKINVCPTELVFSSNEPHLEEKTDEKQIDEQNLLDDQRDYIYWSDDSDCDAPTSDSSIYENTENQMNSAQAYCNETDHNELSDAPKEKSVLHENSGNNTDSKIKTKKNFSEPSSFECEICGRRFTSLFYLYRHARKHTGEFVCTVCKKSFSRNETLLRHQCKRDKTRKCAICGKMFPMLSRLQAHMRSHIRPYKCQLCEKPFSSKHILLTHACPQSTVQSPCPVCMKVFPNPTLLLRHIPVHTGQFSCPLCLRWLATPLSAYNHVLLCSNLSEISETGYKTCTNCGQTFSSIYEYREHEASHLRSFQCQHCGARFHSSIAYHAHQCVNINLPCPFCQEHFDGVPSLQRHKCSRFKKPHQCSLCKCWFGTVGELNEHSCPLEGIPLGSGVVAILESSVQDREPFQARDKFYVCELCGNTFSSHGSLKAHRVIHGEKQFCCDVCGKRFHRKDQLLDHHTKHREAEVPCPDCGKLFKSKKILIAHSRIHTSHKRFSCSICSKEFHQKGNLLKHQQTHVEDRCYECDVCGKFYRCQETFVKHKQVHISGKPIECSFCDKKFAKAFQLKHHLRDQHSGQLYRCPYCSISTKMRHSMIRHLKRKHSSLSSEWTKPGFINSMSSFNNNSEDIPTPRSGRKRPRRNSVELFTDDDSDELDKPSADCPAEQDLEIPVTARNEPIESSIEQQIVDTNNDASLNLNPLVLEYHMKDQVEPEYGVEVEQTEYHFLQGDEISRVEGEDVQHQVVISDNILLNDQQIEELSLKLQQEHTGTFVLDDGTMIQQQEQEGSSDLLFYVIAASETQEV